MRKENIWELLAAGNAAQIEKLSAKKNVGKGGFNISMRYGFVRMEQELEELRAEVDIYNRIICEPSETLLRNIRAEAADVANFAHMIIARCDKELKE